jgi:hypothetical protein
MSTVDIELYWASCQAVSKLEKADIMRKVSPKWCL